MALYIYLKKQPKSLLIKKKEETVVHWRFKVNNVITSRIFSMVVSGIFVILGLSMLSFTGLPMISWQLKQQLVAPEEKIVRPIPVNLITTETSQNGQVYAGPSDNDLLYASNWFSASIPNQPKSVIKEYTMSIPKLDIYNAWVKVGSEKLEESLVHYGGTAIPGEYGNSVVFGHSCLPQFYNPKNYSCIFATLNELVPGDEILVNVDNVEYKYIVYDFKTVTPDDISVLEQRFDNYYLSLITCVPPGLDWKRLVVKAKLERI